MESQVLLSVKNLKKYYEIPQGMFKEKILVRAVDDVNFTVMKGETFALVGESGCGKSTTGRTILRLVEPTAGEVLFKGTNLANLPYDQIFGMLAAGTSIGGGEA